MRTLFYTLLLLPLSSFAQDNPDIYIEQIGNNNQISITQEYSGNTAEITLGKSNESDNNSLTIVQQSIGQQIAQIDIPSGINNSVSINQQGTGNMVATVQGLNGSANAIMINQSGSSNNTFNLIATAGTVNNADVISVTQSGSAGADKSFTLNLNGSSGATVTVEQTNPYTANSGSMTIQCTVCGTYSYIRH